MPTIVRALLAGAALLTATLAPTSFSRVEAAERPSYYPADYDRIVEASKKESGLLIYSILAQYNWQHLIQDFNKLYPWIKVDTLDLQSTEVFTRYYAEKSSGAKTADLMMSSSAEGWLDFVAKGDVMPYASPEEPKLPDWARPQPGYYAISADPMVIAYNKLLVPEDKRPRGIAHLAQLVKENPALFRNGLSTYNVAQSTTAQSIIQTFVDKNGPVAWDWLDVLGPQTRPEMSAGPMLAKLTSGEYKVAYIAAGVVFFPKTKDPATARIIGWNFIDDGTPLTLRMVAVPKVAPNPNAAKLMLDFILSHDGQAALGRGGITVYREDVKQDEVAFYTLNSIREAVGEKAAMLVTYDPEAVKKKDALVERWKQAYSPK